LPLPLSPELTKCDVKWKYSNKTP